MSTRRPPWVPDEARLLQSEHRIARQWGEKLVLMGQHFSIALLFSLTPRVLIFD
jgi:hypothetical protein